MHATAEQADGAIASNDSFGEGPIWGIENSHHGMLAASAERPTSALRRC